MNKDWIYRTNIYEVNVRQYTTEGTFNAFAEHLPRLRTMGIETLWFMPITPISELNKKGSLGSYYACSDYSRINPEFGTLADFKNLVNAAKDLGFKVIIDWVANHTGWDHIWTKEHPDWYKVDAQTGGFLKASGMDDIIELDFTKADVRTAMINSMKFWIEQTDLDGFRCDLASWVNLEFWLEASSILNKIKPLLWLAEADALHHPLYMQVFDVAYTWKWMHKTEDWYKQTLPLQDLTFIMEEYTRSPGLELWFTTNHDENSWNGSEYEKYGEAAGMLSVHSITWPGIPLIYSGQELPNFRRLAFFEKDAIDWSAQPKLESFYQTLLKVKKDSAALDARADVFILPNSISTKAFTFLRKSGEDEVLVFLNFSGSTIEFSLNSGWLQGTFQDVFSNEMTSITYSSRFVLAGWQYKVYKKERTE